MLMERRDGARGMGRWPPVSLSERKRERPDAALYGWGRGDGEGVDGEGNATEGMTGERLRTYEPALSLEQ